jgi:hypothetical protein
MRVRTRIKNICLVNCPPPLATMQTLIFEIRIEAQVRLGLYSRRVQERAVGTRFLKQKVLELVSKLRE